MTGVRRVVLVRHAGTAATQHAEFAVDEPLTPTGVAAAAALRPRFPGVDLVPCSPTARARGTAEAAGWKPVDDSRLGPLDVAGWNGRQLREIAESDPEALAGWRTDPAARPHGGETILELIARVRSVLHDWSVAPTSRVLAVTHAAWIRAAVVVALDAPPEAFWRIDTAPASFTELHTRADTWALVRSNTTMP